MEKLLLALALLTACGGGVQRSDEAIVDVSPDGFAWARWYGANGNEGPIFTGDLNGDGRTDVFMWRNSTNTWRINMTNTTGTGFNAPQDWNGMWGSDGPIFTGDLNGDGKTDVFMWHQAWNNWSVNLTNTTGTGFIMSQWTGIPGSEGTQIFTGDLNGDHKTDVFMWNDTLKKWRINMTNTTGTGFLPAQSWDGMWGSDGPIHTGDLNGDGKTDVFMWHAAWNNWSVNLTNTTGTGFIMYQWPGASGDAGPVFTGDLNGDHQTDVFMWEPATNSWRVNLVNTTGTGFIQQQWFGACGSDGSALLGDFNGDGRQDIAMWRDGFKSWSTNLATFAGDGFYRQEWHGNWGSDGPIVTGDFNKDHRTDVMMWRGSDNSWSVNLSQLTATAPAATTPACGTPTWGSVGPSAINLETNYVPAAGKVDDIQVSPNWGGRPAMYIASNPGGVWRSTDFQSSVPTWTPLTDHLPGLTDAQRRGILYTKSIAVSTLTASGTACLGASSPCVLYVGTNPMSGATVLKSTDGGNTWTLLGQGQIQGAIYRVVVDPQGTVYAATTSGLYISESGGAFVNRGSSSLQYTDVAWYTFPSGTAVFAGAVDLAGVQTGIYAVAKSNGVWSLTRTLVPNQRDLNGIPFANSAVTLIRMSATPGTGVAALMKADPDLLNMFTVTANVDGSFTWSPQWTTSEEFSLSNITDSVALAPDGRIYGGGIGVGQSDGIGGVYNIQSHPDAAGKTIHTDSHCAAWISADQKLYVGTDGGLARFMPHAQPGVAPGNWEWLNTPSLTNLQTEGVAGSPVAPNNLVVGHHDNGVAVNMSGAWNWSPGSNEEDAPFFDPNDSTGMSVYYFDTSQNDFHKSTDGGSSFCTIPCNGAYAPYVAVAPPGIATAYPVAFHPSQANKFMAMSGYCPTGGPGSACTTNSNCCAGLWCDTDGNHTCGGVASNGTVMETSNGWLTTCDLRPPNVGRPTAMAYAGNSRFVADWGTLFQSVDGSCNPTWTTVWSGSLPILSLAGDPQNPSSLYFAAFDSGATTPGHVYFKANVSDGNWTLGDGVREITNDIGIKVQKLQMIPSYGRTPTLYAIGIDQTVNGWGPAGYAIYRAGLINGAGTHWAMFNTGFPDISVMDIATTPWYHGVYAATYGRGAWSVTDYSLAPEAIANLGFETGTLAGWTATGIATTVNSSHSGTFAAQLGNQMPSNGTSSVSQILTLPPTATHLSFWYRMACLGTVSNDWAQVTLANNLTAVTTTLLPATCTNTGQWVNVVADISANANASVTLTLTNRDDNNPGTPTYTLFDDLSVY